jgi:putative heme-binding domain-containing protein
LAKSLAPALRGSLGREAAAADLSRLFVLVSTAPAGRSLVAETLGNTSAPTALRLASLEAMRSARPKSPPQEWVETLAQVLGDPGSTALHGAAISAASAIGAGKDLDAQLQRLGRDASAASPVRIAALAALPAGWKAGAEDVAFLAKAVSTRIPGAADALGRAAVSTEQLGRVLEAVRDAGPMELPRLLPAMERLETEESAGAFVRALATSKARAALRPELLRAAVKNRPEPVKAEAERLLESLQSGRAAERKHLAELKAALPEGDIRRGQNVFNSAKAACIQCHRLGYQGGDVGPDLTAIGTVRSHDDLLEAVVYPSASFVRSYEPMTVATKDGEERTGILRRDDERGVELLTGPGTSLDLRREDITEMRPSTVSLMPAGLEEQLTPQDLADLLAFLKNTKWGRN